MVSLCRFFCCCLAWVVSFVWLNCFVSSFCLWSTLGVMFPVVACRLNSLSSVALFGFVVCMQLIATLRGTNSLEISTPRSIPRSPQFSVVTLMRSLIAPLIGLALIPPSPLAIALPPLHIFLTTAVWWTYGGISTPLLLGLPGPGGMAVLPLVLTFLVFLFRGCPLSLLVSSSPVPFLITVVSSIPDAVPPGPGIWKLNISVLDDPEYVELISNAWRLLRNSISRLPSLAKWWDGGKSLIQGLTIHYCCRKAGAWSRLRDLLVPLINHLKVKVDLGSSSCLGPYHSALAELAALDSHVAKGAQVRSRVKWVEEGESSSSYFFCLERKRGSDRWIFALRDEDDSIVSSPHDLCTSLPSFFSGLSSASPVDPCIQADLLGNLSSSLPDDQSSLC